jgi:hypothetical protein
MLHRQTKHLCGSSEDTDREVAYSLNSNATGNQTTTRQSNVVNSKKVKASDTVDIPINEYCKPQASAAISLKPFKISTNDVLFDTGIDSHQKTIMSESLWSVDAERMLCFQTIKCF